MSIQPCTVICNDGNNNPYGDRYDNVPPEYEDGWYYETEYFIQREFAKADAVLNHPERIPKGIIYGLSVRLGVGAGLASGFSLFGMKATAGAYVDGYSIYLKGAEVTTGTYAYAGVSVDTPFMVSVYAQTEREGKGDWNTSLGVKPNIISISNGALYFGFGWSWDISFDEDAFFKYLTMETQK